MSKKYRVCIVDTPYTLALYLLYCSEEQIRDTYFFVGTNMPPSIIERLTPNVKRMSKPIRWNYWNMFVFRLQCLRYARLLRKSDIYAQDHLFFSCGLLGSYPYTLMEDAPHFFDFYKNFSHFRPFYKNTFKGQLRNFLIGANYGKTLGMNNRCNSILLTSMPHDQTLLENKKCLLCNMSQLWEDSNTNKRNYIKYVFDIKEGVIPSKGVILFTQPFVEDCKLTEEEQISIYRPYIDKYIDKQIYIKVHPRDKINYRSHFPFTKILDNKAPMQVLSAMGWKFEIAITVSSSAVSDMDGGTKVIWIGTNVNDKIMDVYGDIKCPVKNNV